jgi:hypothetical protein
VPPEGSLWSAAKVREGLGARQVAPGTIGQVSGQEEAREDSGVAVGGIFGYSPIKNCCPINSNLAPFVISCQEEKL